MLLEWVSYWAYFGYHYLFCIKKLQLPQAVRVAMFTIELTIVGTEHEVRNQKAGVAAVLYLVMLSSILARCIGCLD
jgi:hypothetical protein